MIKHRRIIQFIFAITLSCSGCTDLEKPSVPIKGQNIKDAATISIESPELAKLILKPKRYKLDVTKDPFQPLFEQKPKKIRKLAIKTPKKFDNVKFIGVAKVNDEYIALLKSDKKTGAFRIYDKIRNYTIRNIKSDRVVLSDGAETITLRRSDKK